MSLHSFSFRFRRDRSVAFTLIELLVVIAIIAVIAVISLPIYGQVARQGRVTKTLANMRQMSVAFISYAGDNNNQLPGRVRTTPGSTTTQHKWIIALQPYYQDYRVLTCPIDPVAGVSYNVSDPSTLLSDDVNNTSYIANGYNDLGAFDDPTVVPRVNVIAEPANTILLGIPNPHANNFYMDFVEHNDTQILNRTAFKDSSMYVFSDGSARPLQYVTQVGGQQVDMTKRPPNSGVYTSWLWLVDKNSKVGANN